MEIKKSEEANLDNRTNILSFVSMGLIFGGSIMMMAFSWKTPPKDEMAINLQVEEKIEKEIEEELIIEESEPPPPPEATPPPPSFEEIEEVEDDIVVEIVETISTDDMIDVDFQETEEKVETTTVYDVVAVSPEFPGGAGEMATFIQKTFEYPEISREMGEQGTVWVEFVVYSDGAIKDVKVVKGVSPALDKEAMRVVKAMPKWKPGEQAGKAVNVRYTIPIKARLG